MFDELFIKEMSSIDAYNYGRQMMEKELNKLGECEYNKGRADAEEEVENRFNRVLDDEKRISYQKGKSDAEAEQKAMCESCIHKVSADDLRAIKYDAVDELSIKCITHIKQSKPLTIEEIIHIIHFEADQMKGE